MMRTSSHALIALAAIFGSASASHPPIKEFDSCGVLSSNFLNDSFEGKYRVAGNPGGCALEGSEEANCFCGPEIDGEERLSEWIWQCGDNISFGPVEGKTCPAKVPVPSAALSDVDVEFIATMRSSQELNCDQNLHPTGFPGDEVCSYSDCEDGGDLSAVCACVDMSAYGLEGPPQWHCLHSTCNCGDNHDSGDAPSSSAKSAPIAIVGTVMLLSSLAILY